MKTQTLIRKMLTENTGKNMLDSGGAYGRNWERNQNVKFENEPHVIFDIWDNEINETVSTYHYLCEILSQDETSKKINSILTKVRNQASKNNKIEYPHWIQECCDVLENNEYLIGKIIKYNGFVNTYNHENNLSQILLFDIVNINNEIYVLLQIHGGCDVRGGYTDTKCFKLNGYITGQVDVYGNIDDKDVSNTYNGYSLTYDDTNDKVTVNKDSKISLDFYTMDETYMYQ